MQTLSTRTPGGIGSKARRYLIPAALFFFFLLLTQISRPAYDDWFFRQQARESGFFSFLSEYYQNANGRVVSNTLVYYLLRDFFWLWRLLNAAMLLIVAYAVPRLVKGRVEDRDLLIGAALLLWLYAEIQREMFFWATGSLNYLWPVAASLLLLIPFADLALREEPVRVSPWLLLLTPLAGGCSEQVGLCCLAFMVCGLLTCIVKKKRIPPLCCGLILGVLAFFLAVILAPAVGNRTAAEIQNHFPDFLELGLGARVALGIRFVYERLFAGLYGYVLLCFGLGLYGFWRDRREKGLSRGNKAFWTAALILLLGAVAPMLLRGEAQEIFFTFKPLTGSLLSQLTLLVPLAFWSAFLGIWLVLLWRTDRLAWLLVCGAICSLVVMCFSPTIYASGWRTAGAAGVMLMVAAFRYLWRLSLERYAVLPLAVPALVNLVGVLTLCYAWFW